MQIRQVGTLLGYGKPQMLEVFKNTLPMDLITNRRLKTSSRDSKKHINQGKVR